MKKLAIIGASYLQEPLILTAKDMGIQTHVFAWKVGDLGEEIADFFYPISIVEKEEILIKCKEIGIDGITSIASDLAMITVNYVANELGLVTNSKNSLLKSTNKHEMRKCFFDNSDPSPKSIIVESINELDNIDFHYPVIVKPVDRSGSRGITKLDDKSGLEEAIENAKAVGFIKKALLEEYVSGDEYSVECISYKGEHRLLAITRKYTTGSPHFIETAHFEPANLNDEISETIKNIVFHALDSLEIEYGASHSEIKIDSDRNIKIIEIGARMGGDYIGSHLVKYSTGLDFVKMVIQVALGEKPDLTPILKPSYVGVRFVINKADLDLINTLVNEYPEMVMKYELFDDLKGEVTDSSNRFGVCVFKSTDKELISRFLPV